MQIDDAPAPRARRRSSGDHGATSIQVALEIDEEAANALAEMLGELAADMWLDELWDVDTP